MPLPPGLQDVDRRLKGSESTPQALLCPNPLLVTVDISRKQDTDETALTQEEAYELWTLLKETKDRMNKWKRVALLSKLERLATKEG